MPELSPSIIAFLFTVMIFGGFSKGAIGFGLIVSTVPFLSIIMPPKDAMAWMAIPILILNLYALYLTRAEWREIRRVPWFLITGALLVPVGVHVVVWLQADITRIGIGLFLLIVVAMRLGGWNPAKAGFKRERLASVLWGAAAGFLHGSLMMPAPPVVLFLNFSGVPRDAFVFLISVSATFFLLLQVLTFASLDAYTSGAVWQSLLLLAPAVLGMWFGNRFRQKISQRVFERLVMGLLGLVGLSLMVRNLWRLF
jgi:hypothetical protein